MRKKSLVQRLLGSVLKSRPTLEFVLKFKYMYVPTF